MKNIQSDMFREMRDRRIFKKAQQYVFDYLDTAFERNVFPTEEALKNLKHFDEDMPKETSYGEAVIDMLHEYGAPAAVPMLGGRYYGFVNGSAVPAGLAAKNMATYWDQNSGMNVISPIAGKLESVVEKWLRQIFGLPENTVAGFVTGTSAANFCGLTAARFRLLKKQGWDVNEKGLFNAPPMRVITGKEAHSTVLKAIALIGFGKENVEFVEVDNQGRMIADALPELDENCLVILQAGNVNSGSFDPIEAVCRKAKKAGAWVHIDGAFGLWAQAVDKLKQLTKGMELADSWAVDGHKTLNTPYDSGIIMCADKEAIVSALHMTGGYIIVDEKRDGMFFTPDMSRRARAIELWATMKYLGRDGIEQMVWNLHERAVQFSEEISEINGFEVLNDVVFNQVVVSCENDELTENVISKIQDLRECWVGGSFWRNRRVIRVSVCAWSTTPEDISRSVASFDKAFNWVQVNAL